MQPGLKLAILQAEPPGVLRLQVCAPASGCLSTFWCPLLFLSSVFWNFYYRDLSLHWLRLLLDISFFVPIVMRLLFHFYCRWLTAVLTFYMLILSPESLLKLFFVILWWNPLGFLCARTRSLDMTLWSSALLHECPSFVLPGCSGEASQDRASTHSLTVPGLREKDFSFSPFRRILVLAYYKALITLSLFFPDLICSMFLSQWDVEHYQILVCSEVIYHFYWLKYSMLNCLCIPGWISLDLAEYTSENPKITAYSTKICLPQNFYKLNAL